MSHVGGGMAMYSDRVSNINKIHHLTDENGEMILQMSEMVLSTAIRILRGRINCLNCFNR